MKEWVAKATRPEVVGGLGGFAGLFDATALTSYRRPLLATSTDGIGTKVAIAQKLDKHDTIGFDLVGMVVDDLVVCGAEPLFMTDYICLGKVVPERIAQIVKGIAEACVVAGTRWSAARPRNTPACWRRTSTTWPARRPVWSRPTRCSAPERVRAGDVVVAMASSGLHSNGYSLVRHVFFDRAKWTLDREVAGARRDARRGAADADPGLRKHCLSCQALNAGRPTLHAMSPHHRRRLRGEPGAGDPGRAVASGSTGPRGRRRRSSGWSGCSAASHCRSWRRR